MTDKTWQERWPDLRVFLEDTVLYACDHVGAVYYHAIQRSWDEYGIEGLSMQLLYISNNLRGRANNKRTVEKDLIKWSKQLDRELAEERRLRDAQGA